MVTTQVAHTTEHSFGDGKICFVSPKYDIQSCVWWLQLSSIITVIPPCRHQIVSVLNSRSGSLGSSSGWHVRLCCVLRQFWGTLLSQCDTQSRSTQSHVNWYQWQTDKSCNTLKFNRRVHSLRSSSPLDFRMSLLLVHTTETVKSSAGVRPFLSQVRTPLFY